MYGRCLKENACRIYEGILKGIFKGVLGMIYEIFHRRTFKES